LIETGEIAATVPPTPMRRLEDGALVAALLLAMALPLIDTIGRPLGGFHVPGGAPYLEQLTLWLAFLGGLVATREQRHLTLSTASLLRSDRAQRIARLFAGAVGAAVTAVMAYGGVRLIAADREQGKLLPGGVPEWIFECILPLALALIAIRFVLLASPRWRWRAAALGAVGAAFALGLLGERIAPLVWPIALVILAGALLGAPVFVAMGGLALLLFFKDSTPVAAVPAEVYRLISSPTLPAIPLLTGCGYVLAESGASRRLVRFFRALFGWLPGGLAVMVAAVCALFTTFTGGSGVTIIALGGLVYPMLREDGYSEGFSLGLVTAAGSLGLLFPPSLPVVLYSVVAGSREMSVPADSLYLAGLLPGLLLVVMVAGYGIWVGYRAAIPRQRFAWGELGRAAWLAKWELLLPVFVIGLFASGVASMVETAAAALAFAIVVECFLMRDLHPLRDLPRALVRSSVLTGAVLILLASAFGLTSYLVDAQVPEALIAWVRTHISSPIVFLLVLNVILLILGSVLEIYSAIIILAPLVAPLGLAFGSTPCISASSSSPISSSASCFPRWD
jgi:tripartite ATP-independent transporter DctM subunit